MQVRTIVEFNGKEYSSDWSNCTKRQYEEELFIIEELLNGSLNFLSIDRLGEKIFFNKQILDRSIITIEKGDDITNTNEAQKTKSHTTLSDVTISSTNSELGSYHWFHTLAAKIKHISEYQMINGADGKVDIKNQGKRINETIQELLDGYDAINHNR